jgi:long-chain acyl-CoA synthetase
MPLTGPPLAKPIDVAQLLRPGLDARPDDTALVSSRARWTWRQIDEKSDRLALGLLSLGLRPGDRVASLMPNRPALLVHYLACIKAGLVAVPLNYRYMPPEIDHALEVSGAAILFSHVERDADVAASRLAGRLPLGRVCYGAAEGGGAIPRFEDLVERTSTGTLAPVAPTAPAFIFFTSGSTGKPKGVTHTRETFGWVLAAMIAGFELSAKDVVLPGSSLSHIGGLAFSLSGLAAGAPVVVPRNSDPDELLPLLRDDAPTLLWILPAPLIALVRDHGARHDDFRSIRVCTSGGDKVPAELEREFTDLTGLAIDEGYGMTEIGCATLNPPSGLNKLGSIGLANAGYQLSIRDDKAQELPTDCEGRLWVRSPANMIGYWNHPDATRETIRDGWLDTGDVMQADADGYLWFRGRKKQIIIHDGSNICPQEVEEALLEHPAVSAAGVVGVHDLVHGENVHAYITLRDGVPRPTGQELIQFARARIGYKAPEVIVILPEMPLNATGKVDRVTLKRIAEERVGAAGGEAK